MIITPLLWRHMYHTINQPGQSELKIDGLNYKRKTSRPEQQMNNTNSHHNWKYCKIIEFVVCISSKYLTGVSILCRSKHLYHLIQILLGPILNFKQCSPTDFFSGVCPPPPGFTDSWTDWFYPVLRSLHGIQLNCHLFPENKDIRVDVDHTSIRRESVGSISQQRRSRASIH